MSSYRLNINFNERDLKNIYRANEKVVIVNGRPFSKNPINAISVPFGQTVDITPIERIDVFVQSNINSGTVVNHIKSDALPVEYCESKKEHTIAYDGSTGKFISID